MNFFFYGVFGLALLVLKTVVFPAFWLMRDYCDPFIPLVIYAATFRPFREGIVLALASGIIVDNFSGAPFGVFFTVYLWIFFAVKWGAAFLNVNNRLLLSLMTAAGAAGQNLILFTVFFLFQQQLFFSERLIVHITGQLCWAAGTGGFFITAVRFLHDAWEMIVNELFKDAVRGNGHP